MEIKQSRPVPLSQVMEVLLKRKGDGELEYEQLQTLEYIERTYNNRESENAASALKELVEMKKFSEEMAIKLVDIKPQRPETVRAILLRERAELTEEEVSQVIELVNR